MVDNKPLILYPFELFDIVTFENISTGLWLCLEFKISGTNKEVSFCEIKNQIIYEGEFDQNLTPTKNEVTIVLPTRSDSLVRKIYKGKKYKVIYGYESDRVMNRQPIPSEPDEGYYIVDILELSGRFEREKDFEEIMQELEKERNH